MGISIEHFLKFFSGNLLKSIKCVAIVVEVQRGAVV